MSMVLSPFHIIGIAIRTTNENGQSGRDIPQLWQRFMTEQIAAKIPNKVDSAILSVYTDYEKDHTRPYTTLIGCRVSSLDMVPQGMMGKTISGGIYTVRTATGKLSDGIVFSEWQKIWSSDLARTFTSDFEVYDHRAQNPDHAEVDIFLSVKE
jgi:predicted transcriptional regulator YdeE